MDLSSLRVCFPVFAATSLLCAPSSPHRHDPAHNHEDEVIPLDEVIISAPLDRPLYQQAQAASILASDALTLGSEASLGQTLSRVPGVSSTYFGAAASRPIIRGLEGDRIKVLQNGLNTIDASAASPDHGVSFDVSNLKSIEVVRGPATLLYGSNAIGGVVNAIDGRIVDEKLEAGTIRGSLGSRFSSVDQGYATNFMLEGGLGHGLAFTSRASRVRRRTFACRASCAPVPFKSAIRCLRARRSRVKIVPNSYLRAEGLSGGLSYVWDEGFIGFSWSEYHSRYGSHGGAGCVHRHEPDAPRCARGVLQSAAQDQGTQLPLCVVGLRAHGIRGAAWTTRSSKTTATICRVEAKHEKIAGLEGVIGFQSDRSDFLISGAEAFMPPSITQTNSVFFFEELAATEKLRFQFGGRYDHIDVRFRAERCLRPGHPSELRQPQRVHRRGLTRRMKPTPLP
jgi:iron complex outermembrane receptor protein